MLNKLLLTSYIFYFAILLLLLLLLLLLFIPSYVFPYFSFFYILHTFALFYVLISLSLSSSSFFLRCFLFLHSKNKKITLY